MELFFQYFMYIFKLY